MDINNKAFSNHKCTENVNGVKTLDGVNEYNKIKDPRKSFDFKIFTMYFVIILLLLASVLIFISSIYSAYANKNYGSDNDATSLNKVKAVYQTNASLKVQPIDKTISDIYEIPVGIKIIELDYTDPLLKGLRVGDIIVSSGGKKVFTIYDLYPNEANSYEDHFISYMVFRNGVYKTIVPYEE